jgi:hypothetical protein
MFIVLTHVVSQDRRPQSTSQGVGGNAEGKEEDTATCIPISRRSSTMVPAATYLAYTLIPVKELMAAAPPSRIDETTRMFEARLKNTAYEKAVWRETVSWCLLDHQPPPPILSQLTVREVCHFAISHSNNLKEGSGVGGVAFGLLQAMGRKVSQGNRRHDADQPLTIARLLKTIIWVLLQAAKKKAPATPYSYATVALPERGATRQLARCPTR